MRIEVMAAVGLFAAAIPLTASRAQGNPCAQVTCGVAFDWGNGGPPPDVDEVYGSPSALEKTFVMALNDAGWRVTPGSTSAAMTITLRLTAQNRVRCDRVDGTNPDLSCHTVERGAASFASSDSTVKLPKRIEVLARCSEAKNYPTFSQFGQYAGEMLVFQLEKGGKGSRPILKCRF
jgi:hypothetical protein